MQEEKTFTLEQMKNYVSFYEKDSSFGLILVFILILSELLFLLIFLT